MTKITLFMPQAAVDKITAEPEVFLAYAQANGFAELVAVLGPTPLYLHILHSDYGEVPPVPLEAISDASALYRAFIHEHNFGSSQAGVALIKFGKQRIAHTVARVSYNGKVWEGDSWNPNAKPIYEP
jgi:hypothetical protein